MIVQTIQPNPKPMRKKAHSVIGLTLQLGAVQALFEQEALTTVLAVGFAMFHPRHLA